ncbi:hypothetical protein DL766_000214 [Monosporascus sp. MC13-8B]|uniref:CsbD-like domain-containing protein n=1 Tax=Monosporascus cannonballus TaxID=155416 RepID=A0ABY0H1Q3_9PEZI|nr:hypothetical protein DL762_006526 [Monosporascus cannonballus]RYO83766.1 hypothetical protein DL763_007729 [Monosporascus cannonballus]RYP39772.1 hypothetical protein DL766_000214 [Monosporascus sp. MC13-8B]
MSENNSNQQPSLVGGHAEYVKGAAESTIGSVTGSHAWTSSGEQAKAHAVDTMKAAGEARDPATQGYGKAEQKLGEVTGCEGMAKEGAACKRAE